MARKKAKGLGVPLVNTTLVTRHMVAREDRNLIRLDILVTPNQYKFLREKQRELKRFAILRGNESKTDSYSLILQGLISAWMAIDAGLAPAPLEEVK